MTDMVSKKQRSKIMRSVKSRGNHPTELKLIQLFKQRGIKGWRRNYQLVGKPDFVFPKARVVLFADGCFWHGHDCRNTTSSPAVPLHPQRRRNGLQGHGRSATIQSRIGVSDIAP